jgi:hypothetical protein
LVVLAPRAAAAERILAPHHLLLAPLPSLGGHGRRGRRNGAALLNARRRRLLHRRGGRAACVWSESRANSRVRASGRNARVTDARRERRACEIIEYGGVEYGGVDGAG